MRFTTRRPVIEAVQCSAIRAAEDTDDWALVPEWARHLRVDPICGAIHLQTAQGNVLVHPEDWIIRDIQDGQLRSCGPRVFDATFDAVPMPGCTP